MLILVWLQGGLLGLSPAEQRLWKQAASSPTRQESLLCALGYWLPDTLQGRAGPRHILRRLQLQADSPALKIIRPNDLRRWRGSRVTPLLLAQIPYSLQRSLTHQGYLFAEVSWTHLSCDSVGQCTGTLQVKSGRLVKLDTLLLRGKWNAPRSAFYRVTGLRPHAPLSASHWENLPTRLKRLPYATLIDTPHLWLFPEAAWIEVKLQPKSSNRLDGVLSVLPTGRRPQLIGQIELILLSPLRLGEKLELRWEQLPARSQRLLLQAALPYLFRGTMELKGSFRLWRQDTSFLTREVQARLAYHLTSHLSLFVGAQTHISRLLSTTLYRDRVWPPPPVLDFRRQSLQIGWEWENVDFALAPRKGWGIEIMGAQGRRLYLRNPGLPRLAYERLPSNSLYQEAMLTLEKYTTLSRLLVLYTALRGYAYWSQGYFENELRRPGGEIGLRGFAENTLPTPAYGSASIELRLPFEEEGYLAGLAEGAYLALFSRGTSPAYTLGLAFQTRLPAGILHLTFAAGKLGNAPFDIRRTLVRLNWIAEF
ncbi:MAG: outer membrane protein assembly factor [Bacteroidia bacterium]|nr:outer membrane protein assembly factor [Bacteroidia bacterium]MDW8236238.1 hypothetical protein [Bacteroidia bacterium]